MKHVTSVNPQKVGSTQWKRTCVALAVAALAGCATTEVMEYRAAPGTEVIVGKGGAMKAVEGVEIWFNGGTPPRAFKIIAEAKTDYQTGIAGDLGDRAHALSQLAGEAKKRSADGVIVYDEASEIAGIATMPGYSSTSMNGSINSRGSFNARSNTTTGPGYSGAMKSHSIGALFVKYQ